MPGPVFGAGGAPLKTEALSLKPTGSFLKWFSGPCPFLSIHSTKSLQEIVSIRQGTRSLGGG